MLGDPGFESRQRQDIFLPPNVHIGAGAHLVPIQWILGYFTVLRRPGREIGHLPPASA